MQYLQPAFLFAFTMSLLTGCANDARVNNGTRSDEATLPTTQTLNEGPPQSSPPVSTPVHQQSDPLRGIVKETMDSGGYTYTLVTADQGEVWAAARKFTVAVGDTVELTGLQPMRNFRSSKLDRVFEEIFFVGLAKVIGEGASVSDTATQPPTTALPPGHPPIGGSAPLQDKSNPSLTSKLSQVERLAGGVTVAELFAKKAELAGKIVKFRGRVVKASRMILGSNWLHIQDGTGAPGTNDITVTSKKDFAAVGSIVVIEGTLGIDKDFGAGYSYGVIVENATVVTDTSHQEGKGLAPGVKVGASGS